MAITTTPQDLYELPQDLLNSPVARRALAHGQLVARRAALASAERLARWGWPLLIAIVLVSFAHLWDTIALIRPQFVEELRLPTWAYHITAAALTLAIDAAAMYTVAADAPMLGHGRPAARRWSLLFFLLLTFLLNCAFVVRYAPALPVRMRDALLPGLDILFAVALPAFIPIAILAIEQARGRIEQARLRLLLEVTALGQLVQADAPRPVVVRPTAEAPKPEKALESISGLASPGRPGFALENLIAAVAVGDQVRRADVVQRLGCGESTADRLLAEALAAGQLVREARGIYSRVS